MRNRTPSFESSFETSLTHAWQRRGLLACLLWPLSVLFGLAVSLRQLLYAAGVLKSTDLPLPVIVIGNIFVGGTGKTPLVIWLVEQLRQHGYVPGVISRGYRSNADVVTEVSVSMSPHQVGDEPLLIAARAAVPVVVGRDRVAAAQALLSAHPEVNVILSDDGLQHYALGRTLEIQLSDARGHGNGWLLPAGPLREPVSRRSDFYVVNGEAVRGAYRMQLLATHAERLSDRSQRESLAALAGKSGIVKIAAAAGIGNPERFFTMLRQHGITLADTQALPDHFDFSIDPFAGNDAESILITEKDAVKCAGIDSLAHDARLWVVPVEAAMDGSLAENIVEKLRGHPTA